MTRSVTLRESDESKGLSEASTDYADYTDCRPRVRTGTSGGRFKDGRGPPNSEKRELRSRTPKLPCSAGSDRNTDIHPQEHFRAHPRTDFDVATEDAERVKPGVRSVLSVVSVLQAYRIVVFAKMFLFSASVPRPFGS